SPEVEMGTREFISKATSATSATATTDTTAAAAVTILSSGILCAVHLAGARTECFGKRVERALSQDAEAENSNGCQLRAVRRGGARCTVRSRKRFELASELLQILLSFSCDAISKAVVKNQRERDCGEDRCRKEMPEVHQGGHDKREKKEEDKCS